MDPKVTEQDQWFLKLAEAAVVADSQAHLAWSDAPTHPGGL